MANFSAHPAAWALFNWVACGLTIWLINRAINSRKKPKDEPIMEVIFTNDKTEEVATRGLNYLQLSQLDSRCKIKNLSRIIEYVDSAKRCIDVAIYMFNVKELGKAFIRAHERGVIIKIVGCTSMAGATGTQYPDLTNAGLRAFVNI